jgi:FKBP-type peptidyl-prolyl cis-trans isomerase 2
MVLKKGDFVEINFIGKVAATEQIFENNSVVVCIGAGRLLKAVEDSIEGKNIGDEYEIKLEPKEAFGQRNPNLIQLIPLQTFKEKGINPAPGLQVNIDGVLATIRAVSGGRVIVDFNHPLAGKALKFWIKINKQITDVKEKLYALLKEWDAEISISENEIDIKISKKLPEKVCEAKYTQLKKWIPEIQDKKINFLLKEVQNEAKTEHQS